MSHIKNNIFENQYPNAVLKIANEIDRLTTDKKVRKRFTSYVNKLCGMVEDYGQTLQPYAEKLEKAKEELEKTKLAPGTTIVLVDVCPPPKGWVKMSYTDNFWTNVDMGVIYRPVKPVNPLLWFGISGNASIQRKPAEDESLMCEYVRLAVIHDYELREPTDKPIFSNKYIGKWFKRDEFRNDVGKYYHYANQPSYVTAEEKLSQLNRALDRVKADKKKPWYKKTWTWIVGTVVFLAALTTLVLNIDKIKERFFLQKTQIQEEKTAKIFAYVSPQGEILKSSNFPWKIKKTKNKDGNVVYIIDGRQGDATAVSVYPYNSTKDYTINNTYSGLAIEFTYPEEKISNFRIDVKY
ncbi:MAG: hypothetical protein NTW93_03615 [Phycisphaerae bacterium]|nr:hypothetical protein [Phycisphaerae bacterium]